MLAETATKEIANTTHPQGFEENKTVAERGENMVKVDRETLEQETGQLVITPENALDFGKLIHDVTTEIVERNK